METPPAAPVVNPGVEFAQHLVQHDRALRRYIMSMLPRRADADEVMQRTVVKLWQGFSGYDRSREFLPWAIHLTYYEILNFRKEFARGRLLFREEVMQALVDCRPEYDELQEQRRLALEKCLGSVSKEGIRLLRRRYCDAESIAELATEWGQTAKTLYRRLDRLRAILAECVQHRLVGVPHE